MTLLLNDDQREFQHTLRSVFEKHADSKRVRSVQAAGGDFDREAWAALIELGATATLIPEEFGGSGYSFVELGIVLEEMGRALLCAPFFSTVVLAGNTLLQSGDEAVRSAALELLAAGRRHGLATRGLLVEPMAEPGVELIVGLRRDALFGPAVMVGLGGVLAEVLDDVAIRLAPVRHAEALEPDSACRRGPD